MSETPPAMKMFIVISIATLAAIGVTSICLSLFFKTYSDPATLTAVITTTGNLTGALIALLVNTRSTPKNGTMTDTTTQSTTTTTTKPPLVSDTPAPVIVKNPDPIPVTEAPKP